MNAKKAKMIRRLHRENTAQAPEPDKIKLIDYIKVLYNNILAFLRIRKNYLMFKKQTIEVNKYRYKKLKKLYKDLKRA